jgi:hypothetical protein
MLQGDDALMDVAIERAEMAAAVNPAAEVSHSCLGNRKQTVQVGAIVEAVKCGLDRSDCHLCDSCREGAVVGHGM